MHSDPPGLRELTIADWRTTVIRAAREAQDDNVPMMASALAYSAFFAIPSVLLVVLGLFTLVTDPATIESAVDDLTRIAPAEVTTLLGDSLQRLNERPSAGIALTAVGLVLALWSMTSAMSTAITALDVAYEREDRRGFLRRRLVALAMAACVGAAALLAAGLLVLGPHLEDWVGEALDARTLVAVVWWTCQWPILVVALLFAFAVVLYLGPDADEPRWRLLTPGSVLAVAVWIVASGGFSLYAAWFGSYDKTWGSLAAVIVTLVWLWLTGLALLFGGELNAEWERLSARRAGNAQRPGDPAPPTPRPEPDPTPAPRPPTPAPGPESPQPPTI